MSDQRKTKKQLLEDLERERERALRERERSIALQEVSNEVAAAHDTDELLELIVNETVRLLGASSSHIRLLEGDTLVLRVATGATETYMAGAPPFLKVEEGTSLAGHVMATKKPLSGNGAAQTLLPSARRAMAERGRDPESIAAVPLLANGQSIGTLILSDETPGRRFTDDEVSLIVAFADQASLAIEKARLLNEAKREKERSDALYRVSNLLAGAHDTDEVLDLIVNEATRLVGASGAWLRLLKGDQLLPGAATESVADFITSTSAEMPTMDVGQGTSINGHAMATRRPYLSPDVTEDELATQMARTKLKELGLHGSAAVPLLANDRSIGVLVVMDRTVRRFTDDEVSLLTAFADQAALALEKARLLNEAEREKERSDALYRVSNLLAGAHDTDEVLDLIVNEATRLVGATGAFLRLLEGEGLVPSATTESMNAYHAEVGEANLLLRVEEGNSMIGHVMATKKPRVSEDVTLDSLLLR
ncbi:MAG: hypothetical protein BZY87_01525 [SAR202 cluster bacterium Io17-Chloro-G6]|nr:MAG: hypothetical protein BZY87_01525 [SAR202 cluster bacterium Io17-Chloro-G6]